MGLLSKIIAAIFWAIGVVASLAISGMVLAWIIVSILVSIMGPFYLFEFMRHTWP